MNTITQKLVLSNSTIELSSTFHQVTMAAKWLQCCKEAELCCTQQLNRTSPDDFKDFCPRSWDGWSCWPDGAKANELVKQVS